MSNLSLSIRSHDLHLFAERFPLLPLFFVTNILNCKRKHRVIKTAHVLTEMTELPTSKVALVFLKPFALSVEFLGSFELLHVMSPHFFLAHFIEFMSIHQNGIAVHEGYCVLGSLGELFV
jgi:hypothetical protein